MIDIKNFEVTPAIVAHALQYLLNKPGPRSVSTTGVVEAFVGWGDRAVLRVGDKWQLRSFRRFEYTILKNVASTSIDVTATIDEFRRVAATEKGEGNE